MGKIGKTLGLIALTVAGAVVGGAIGGVIGGTLLGVTAASIGATIGSAVFGLAGQLAFGGARPSSRSPGVPVTLRQPVPMRVRVYGRKRVGGAVIFPQLVNENKDLLLIIALSEGPVRGPLKIWFDETVVWERAPGADPINGDIAGYGAYLDDWDQFALLRFWDGTQTAADPVFVDLSRGGSGQPRDLPVQGNESALLANPANVAVSTRVVSESGTRDLGRKEDPKDVTEVVVSWDPLAGAAQFRVTFFDAEGTWTRLFVAAGETEVVVGREPEFNAATLRPAVAARDSAGNWTDAVKQTGDAEAREDTWGPTDILTGVAYIACRLTRNKKAIKQRRFPRGVPSITVEMEGAADIGDPRDASVGYSANAALCLRHYLLDAEPATSVAPGAALIGVAAPLDEIDDDAFSAHANLADEAVVTNDGGSEPRYEINGSVVADEERAGTLSDLAVAAASDIVWSGGQFRPVNGEVPPVSFTITDDMTVGERSIGIERSRADHFNTVSGTFQGPDNDYVPDLYPARKSPTGIAADGREIQRRLNLPFTNSADMAQRIAQAGLFESRKKVFPTLPLGIEALQLEVGDQVAFVWKGFNAGFRVDALELRLPVPDDGEGSQPIVVASLSEAFPEAFQINQADLVAAFLANVRRPPQVIVKPPVAPEYSITQRQMNDGGQIFTSLVTWQPSVSEEVRGYEVIYVWDDTETIAFTAELRWQIDLPIRAVRVRTVGASGLVSVSVPAVLTTPFSFVDVTPPPVPTADLVTQPLTPGAPGEVTVRVDKNPATDFAAFQVYVAPTVSDLTIDDTGLSDQQFIELLFEAFFQRVPTADGLTFWLDQLAGGATREDVKNAFGASFENAQQGGPAGKESVTTINVAGLPDDVSMRIFVTAVDTTGNESGALELGPILLNVGSSALVIRDDTVVAVVDPTDIDFGRGLDVTEPVQLLARIDINETEIAEDIINNTTVFDDLVQNIVNQINNNTTVFGDLVQNIVDQINQGDQTTTIINTSPGNRPFRTVAGSTAVVAGDINGQIVVTGAGDVAFSDVGASNGQQVTVWAAAPNVTFSGTLSAPPGFLNEMVDGGYITAVWGGGQWRPAGFFLAVP